MIEEMLNPARTRALHCMHVEKTIMPPRGNMIIRPWLFVARERKMSTANLGGKIGRSGESFDSDN